MAAWQVDFYLVPRAAIGIAATVLTPGELDSTEWWAVAAFPADYQLRLDMVATRGRSWTARLETWGSEDGNRVDVALEDGRVQSVIIRVDVRRLDSKFGAALIEFTRKLGALLIRRDGLIIEPTIAAYAGALRTSIAWRFANDPAAFLASHAADVKDDD
jgi:hypothetical protein